MGRGEATSRRRELFEDYDGFVEKFKPKKTTDDCYTPDEIYEVVAEWVAEKYGVRRSDMVRPFWPGGDYESFDYPDGCCVVDNPPFSILAKIQRFYLDEGIPFFLFAPSLTCLSGASVCMDVCHVVCDAKITYENGAVVMTSFVTSMGGDVVAESEPELSDRINEANDRRLKQMAKSLPKYEYPDEVLTAAKLQWMARHHTRLVVRRGDCCRISKLDANPKKGIFGGGLLLSERAAAERAVAERAAAERAVAERAVAERAVAERAAAERARAHVWELSDRERAIVSMLGGDS